MTTPSAIRPMLASPASQALFWTAALAALLGLLTLWTPTSLLILAIGIPAVVAAVRYPFAALAAYCFTLATVPRVRILVGTAAIPVYLVDLCLATCLLGILLRVVLRRWTWNPTPLDRLVWFLLLSVVPGFLLLIFRFPVYAAESVYFLARYLIHMGAFFLFTQLVRSRARLNQLLALLLIGMFLDGIWAITQSLPQLQFIGIPFTDLFNAISQQTYSLAVEGDVRRAAAGFNVANDFGGFMAMFLPFVLFHSFPKKRFGTRVLVLSALLFAGAGLLVSFSRTAIAGLVAGLGVSWLIMAKKGILRTKAPVYLAALAVSAVVLTMFSGSVGDVIAVRAVGYADPLDDSNFQARIIGHYRFAAAVAEDPLMLVFGEGLRLNDLERRRLIPPDTFKGFVSNSWLLILLDSGIFTFIIYVSLYGRALALLLSRIASVPAGCPVFPPVLAALASLVALFFTHLIDNYMAGMIFMKGAYFSVLGLSMAVLSIPAETPSDVPAPRRAPHLRSP